MEPGIDEQDEAAARRRMLVVVPAAGIVVGILFTVAVRFFAGNLAADSVRDRFDDRARLAMDATEQSVRRYLDEIRDISSYAAVDTTTGPRFQSIVRLSGVLDEVPGEQAISYVAVESDGTLELTAIASDVQVLDDEGPWPLGLPEALAPLASPDAAPGIPILLDLGVVAEGFEGVPGVDDLVLGLDAVFMAPEGYPMRYVPAVAMPVRGPFEERVRGHVVAELLPREVVTPVVSGRGDDVTVTVVLLGQQAALPFVDPPTDVALSTSRTMRVEGLEWGLDATAPSSFGASTVAGAERAGTIIGLLLAVVATVLLVLRGRHTLAARDMREELGATQVEARRDPLTGLVNRAGFMENLDRAISQLDQAHRYVAVLFVDVDRLKVINDSLGHSTGDLALVEIARRFRSVGRWTDTVARFGGDEFVILCSGLQQASDSVRVAEQILLSLAQPIRVDEMELVMSASVGVAVASLASRTDAESLVRDADTAMYEAKAAGGNRIVLFDDGLRVKVTGRLQVERSLRSAVENGELDVHFQPIVDARSGSIVSAEALVRWFPKEGGSISPGVFMPVASETGMVVQIGDFVLQRACLLASELERMFPGAPPISIAVNVAERQLLDPGFVNRVRQYTQAARIWPRQITLEITEDVMIDRLGRSLEVLRKLADIGFGLAIDDFGTGMSSLSYVKRLDMVKFLKVDRAFVIDVATDPADRAIVSSVVAMARTLGVTVVAEGVEEPEQAAVLQSLGVDRMQGFLWSKAIPAPEFRELVRAVMGPRVAAMAGSSAP